MSLTRADCTKCGRYTVIHKMCQGRCWECYKRDSRAASNGVLMVPSRRRDRRLRNGCLSCHQYPPVEGGWWCVGCAGVGIGYVAC